MNAGKVIAAYWVASFHGRLSPAEEAVFTMHLDGANVQDAKDFIDTIAAQAGYPPTAQAIAAACAERARSREVFASHQTELPRGDVMTLAQWMEHVATAEQRATMLRVAPGLKERLGINLEET